MLEDEDPTPEFEQNVAMTMCGLPAAVDSIGDRWVFLILRAAFAGLRHFDQMQPHLGIARNILSNRLTRLTQQGILTRKPCREDRRRVEYRLTSKGEALLPAMIALRQWGERWGTGKPSNPALVDVRDGHPVATVEVRAADGRPLDAREITFEWFDETGETPTDAPTMIASR